MTLLTIVQNAADALNIPSPSVVISSTDPQVKRLLRFANQEGKEMVKRHEWEGLTKEKTFSTTAADVQASAVPTDFDRFINQSLWNRTTLRQLVGPISAQEWAAEKGSGVASTYHDYFRLRGGDFLITPTPAAGETIAYEYISTYWVDTDADGAGDAASWQGDTNTSIIPEELITLGVIWRFRADVGLDYAEDMQTAEQVFKRYAAQEKGAPILRMNRRKFVLGPANVPETGFGS